MVRTELYKAASETKTPKHTAQCVGYTGKFTIVHWYRRPVPPCTGWILWGSPPASMPRSSSRAHLLPSLGLGLEFAQVGAALAQVDALAVVIRKLGRDHADAAELVGIERCPVNRAAVHGYVLGDLFGLPMCFEVLRHAVVLANAHGLLQNVLQVRQPLALELRGGRREPRQVALLLAERLEAVVAQGAGDRRHQVLVLQPRQ